MTLTKVVNGKRIELTQEEEDSIRAQWNAPTPPEEWHARISQRAETELQRGVSVTIDGTTYGIRTGPQELALIGSGALAADRARRGNRSISEKVPTDKGVADFDADALDALFEAVRSRRAAIMGRVEDLQQMVEDGTITDGDLSEGWP